MARFNLVATLVGVALAVAATQAGVSLWSACHKPRSRGGCMMKQPSPLRNDQSGRAVKGRFF